METNETMKPDTSSIVADASSIVADATIIPEGTTENIQEFLQELIQLKDKKSIYQYVIANEAAHRLIQQTLFADNPYKVRIEEIAGMQYTATSQFRDNETPQIYLSPIDVARAVSVYTDYEGNAVMIEDLFNVYKKEWTKQQTTTST